MSEAIKIVEVGPRDGLQNEAHTISSEEKVQLIRHLKNTGLKNIEAGAFVSAKAVPQMADSAYVMEGLSMLGEGVNLPVLVPNLKGYETAIASGAKEVAVEFFTLSKSYNMPGWRVGFCCGNKELLSALSRIKSYFDYGLFTPIQVAAIKALDEGDKYVDEIRDMYQSRRDVLIEGLNKAGWKVESPKATMFIWAKIPSTHKHLGSLEFSKQLLSEAQVAVSPGIGFGTYGEGYVRFSLIENEHRSRQAIRNIKKFLSNTSNIQAVN